MGNTLKSLFKRHKCAKNVHLYEDIYEKEFADLKEKEINILEIGVYKGASVDVWLDYFPNAQIYCVDVFTRLKPEEIDVLNRDRVYWYKADSTHPSFKGKIDEVWPGVKFDIIIDDGKHTPQANANTFNNLIHTLAEGGTYYVEDVLLLNQFKQSDWNHDWVRKDKDVYTVEFFKEFVETFNGYNVEIFDMRKYTKRLDSAIYKITR
jgi:hypothetical protein